MFALELKGAIKRYYQNVPSNEQFARDFSRRSGGRLQLSRETARKWLKARAFPDLEHLVLLIEWLEIDMGRVFLRGPNENESA